MEHTVLTLIFSRNKERESQIANRKTLYVLFLTTVIRIIYHCHSLASSKYTTITGR